MMRGRVEPFVVPTMVHAIRQITTVPQMTSPHEKQPREQRYEIPQMTSPQEKQLRDQSHGVKREHDKASRG